MTQIRPCDALSDCLLFGDGLCLPLSTVRSFSGVCRWKAKTPQREGWPVRRPPTQPFVCALAAITGPQPRGTGGTLMWVRTSHRDRGHQPRSPVGNGGSLSADGDVRSTDGREAGATGRLRRYGAIVTLRAVEAPWGDWGS